MSEPIDLTYDKALMLLKQVVAKAGGDWAYEPRPIADGSGFSKACRYVHDDRPDCGVGKALHSAGVPLEALRRQEGKSASQVMYYLMGEGCITTDQRAMVLYRVFQGHQDSSTPWGKCLTYAIDHVNGWYSNA